MDKIKEFEEKIKQIDKVTQISLQETDKLILRRREAVQIVEAFEENLGTLQRKRQNLLGLGDSVVEVTKEIARLKEVNEESKDAISGISKKLEELELERVRLKGEKIMLSKKIIAEKIKPLIPEYNRYAEKLSSVLPKLWELINALNDPVIRDQVVCSTYWGGALRHVPRLYLFDEYDPKTAKDFFKW